MFAKLLKYEWKATSKMLGILSLCILGAGVISGGAIRAIDYLSGKIVNDGMAAVAIGGFVFLIFGMFMALIAYALGTQFYLLFRFYKTRFTDQGYLTFTLPVSNRSIFLSSYVNTLFWMLISAVTIIAAFLIAALIGVTVPEDIFNEILYAFSYDEDAGAYIALQCVGSLVSGASSVMIMMASVTAGAVAAKKHKILAAIGIYYGQSIVMGILSSALQVFATFSVFTSANPERDLLLVSTLTYVLQAAWAVGAYFLSMHLINRKLNLP